MGGDHVRVRAAAAVVLVGALGCAGDDPWRVDALEVPFAPRGAEGDTT